MFRRPFHPLGPRPGGRFRWRGRELGALSLLTACLSAPTSVVLAAAPAAVAEPLRVRVSTALIDEVVAGLLPLDVVLPAQPGTAPDAGSDGTSQAALITELRYCGATDKGTGRFRAVLRWGAMGAGQPLLSGGDGCRQSLGDLAKRAGADLAAERFRAST